MAANPKSPGSPNQRQQQLAEQPQQQQSATWIAGRTDAPCPDAYRPPPSVPSLFLATPSTLLAGLFTGAAATDDGNDASTANAGVDAPPPPPPGEAIDLADESRAILASPTGGVNPGGRNGARLQAKPRLVQAKELAAWAREVPADDGRYPLPGLTAPTMHALAAVYGRALGPALRIAANASAEVQMRFCARTRRSVHVVSGHPCVSALYCACSAFKFLVVNKGEAELCKHQVALLVLQRFGAAAAGTSAASQPSPFHRPMPAALVERIESAMEVRASATSAAALSRHDSAAAPPPAGTLDAAVGAGWASNTNSFNPNFDAATLLQAGSRDDAAEQAAGRQNAAATGLGALGGPSAASIAAAAAPVTFTDTEGITWTEMPEAEFAALLST